MEEALRNTLLDLAARYMAATDLTPAALGKKALNDNTFFVRIQSGDGFTIKTLDKLLLWFSANWPEGVEWPKGVERPVARPTKAKGRAA